MNDTSYMDELKKQIDALEKIKEMKKYNQIIESYDSNKLVEDFMYIFDSIPIMTDILSSNDPRDPTKIYSNIDDMYWSLKGLANMINFIKCMKPIMGHFNPSDEDKARFVEFIKTHPLPGNPIDEMCQQIIESEEDDNE